MHNILFLTSHLPYPPTSGGRRREYEIIKRLCYYQNIYLCCVSKTFDEDYHYINIMRQYCIDVQVFPASDIKALPDLLTQQYPPQILRNASGEMGAYIREITQRVKIDIIHAEGFYMVQNIPREIELPLFLVEQNIEYLLYYQRYSNSTDAKASYLLQQYHITKKVEQMVWKQSSLCAVLTKDDERSITSVVSPDRVRLIPDGIDHTVDLGLPDTPLEAPMQNADDNTVLFVGNFDYEPNHDGAIYFCSEILPMIKQRIPNIQVFLVGNAPSEQVRAIALKLGVNVTGRVNSLHSYLSNAKVVICPLRIGGGIKVKLLEALRYGKAIVTTSVGAQGLPICENPAFWLADDPALFAGMVVTLLQDSARRLELERNAGELASSLPSWDTVVWRLNEAYSELVAQPQLSEDMQPR